jgi:hypothetical protein
VARRRVHVWKNQLGTKLQEEPLKDWSSRINVGRNLEASSE